MEKFITAVLICAYCGLSAQPGQRLITLNINEYKPSKYAQAETRRGLTQYYFIIDSTSNLSKLTDLQSFTSLNLIVRLRILPQEIRLLSDSLRSLSIFADDKLADLSNLRYLDKLENLTIYGFTQSALPN